MKDIQCPYCEEEQDINHDDGQGYAESEAHTQQCKYCEKTFVYYTSIHFSYEAKKADCLNDGEHDYKPSSTYPTYFTKMQCSMCDHERKPTAKERELHNIPTEFKL